MSITVHTILEEQSPAAAIELTDSQVKALGGSEEHVRAILDAKRPDTRERRVAAVIEKLS